MIKHYILKTLYIILCLIAFNRIALAETFVVTDVPAMQNMFVGEPIELDTLAERVVQVTTSTPSTKNVIFQYYSSVLPNFGWKKITNTQYKRKTETLKIIIVDTDADGTTVEFSLLSQ